VAKMLYDPGPIECLIKNAEDTEITVKLCGMNGASLRSTPNRRQIANYPACMIYKTPKGNMHTCFDLPGVRDVPRCSKYDCQEQIHNDEISHCCCTSSLCNGVMT
ncbi:hypothetical protein PMAYCL1PPCAC_30083, partial [Pristionchus mayeri]